MIISNKFFRFIQSQPKILLHILVWIVYLVYSYLLNLLTFKEVKVTEILALNIPLIFFFYLCFFGFTLMKKNFGLAILYFAIIFGILFGLGYYLIDGVFPKFGIDIRTKGFSFAGYAQEVIMATIKFFVYALLYFSLKEWLKSREDFRNSEIERLKLEEIKTKNELENMQYQYAFLRSQVNPHFLYNTLNVFFSEALKVSPSLADNILKLSDVMRYSLEGSAENNDKILLQKELDQLKNVIDIFQLRFSDKKQIKLEIQGEIQEQKIPVLSIITVVENAFKYGDLNDSEFPLEINIFANTETVIIKLKNKKKKNTTAIVSNNIGMNNLKKRLAFSYEGKYILNIDNQQDYYSLYLEIKQK